VLSVRIAMLAGMLLSVSGPAAGEPYLAVFQGMQCSSCHSHPAGGGLRNAYGNTYAQTELPSRRAGKSDAAYWTGVVADWLSVGGDLRAEYRYVDTPNVASQSAFDVSKATLYVEASIIPGRLSVYIDQQLAPGSSLNREAYVRLKSTDHAWYLAAGQFFLPYGLRLQDDTAFVRLASGVNFTAPDRGVQVGYEHGPWSTQLSLTNGSGGGTEFDAGKQASFVAQFVQSAWRAGASANHNNSELGDRTMYSIFAGIRTGPIAWLAEADVISDELPAGSDRNAIAGLVEANWRLSRGHNIKVTYDYFDPDDDISENQQARYSLIWEHSPMQFMQGRVGVRLYDGIPQVDSQNRDEYFVELHGFF